MVRLAVMTDVHANLPALKAALAAIERLGVDGIVHTGDAIAIGPQPAECLDLLLNTAGLRNVMGNHDAWFAWGLPQPRPDWMSDGELAHQEWTHAQLDPALRTAVAAWPFSLRETVEGARLQFTHYALDASGRGFQPVRRAPNAADLDALFAGVADADVLCYGHDHTAGDVVGRMRYVNPGALGCHTQPLARFVLLAADHGRITLTHHAAPYDDALLTAAFRDRNVPDAAFINRIFFGGRLPL